MEKLVCLASIRNLYDHLTKTERQIADYVLTNSEVVVNMNVAALSKAANVAGSAIIRFCKSIGYTGFSQFRLSLAMELASRPKPLIPALSSTDSSQEITLKVFDSGLRTLQNTVSMLDFDILEQFVEKLISATRICVFGVGTSSPIAEDAQFRFLQLGYPASCYRDILFMPIAALNMKKGEVAIAISHSGQTESTLESLKLAKQQGAITAAITSYRSSPLAKISEFAITAYPDDINYPVQAVSARLAHICILDAITVILTLRGGEKATELLKNRDLILHQLRKNVES